ncbi:peptidase C12, ubiquitin carboxyl-terminal hydrolase [Pavlovales sp. CCMP2436]|nr:peptidase C12, ubiquitin carboxyl-terminal hydrolase [Pavlovales sp. CCMP2436]|mmetsp:Transcript_11819/g.27605  ORF Transcript_11819/g.27605 Transcript_11819/m.27605 type:complete len:262 (+) Transcript_11819:22-807(+)|eukprot:CAMPEP_0179848566 /NCGR_PEP_ID=MMETSP0982-20121206/6691_1 /TAXON_ID=483367 /ORGANISM="non described non described, Strain CCMP 2436" /LENGTH=261 /DNA_ID=CAMNT_0021733839 /DNA_START=39 /DNA_END=824 /DNA_ORIENTATION=-
MVADKPDLASLGSSSAWLPLESNPKIFDAFGQKIGLPEDWGFFDVLGLDEELLGEELLPKPCSALILLFPCIDEVMARRRVPPPQPNPPLTDDITFVSQHAEAGNACGTIATIHAIINSRHAFELGRGPLNQLLDGAAMSADERGRLLLGMADIRERSDAAAEDQAAQTACPSREADALDHHFVAIVCSSQGRLVELDGTKPSPIDHGEATVETFVSRAATMVKERFLPRDTSKAGSSIEFALVALCRKPSSSADNSQLKD